MMKGKQLVAKVLGITALALGGAFAISTATQTSAKAATSYTTAINKGASYIKTKTPKDQLDAWDAFAVKRSPKGMSSAAKKVFTKELALQFKHLGGHYAAVDYERTLMGAVSIGANPTKYQGVNLVSGIIKTAPKSNAGINAKIWGAIALSTKNYGSTANKTVKTLISQIVKAQNSQGGWALNGSASDVDITGMALIALSEHTSYTGVKTAIKKAESALTSKAYKKSTGDFVLSTAFTKKANADSNAMAIAGLSAAGVNPGTKAVNRLIKFQKSTGQFRWLLNSNTGALHMATQQSTYALEQYRAYKLHKGSIFKF